MGVKVGEARQGEVLSGRASFGYLSFPGGSDGKGSAYHAGDLGLIHGSGRSPGEGNGYGTPIFLSGEPNGHRSLTGYSPWHLKELDIVPLSTSEYRFSKADRALAS